MCGFTPGADLISWSDFQSEREAYEAELDQAAEEIQTANFSYEHALRRLRCAPHGELQNRRRDLRVANARILAAELRYAEAKRREPHW